MSHTYLARLRRNSDIQLTDELLEIAQGELERELSFAKSSWEQASDTYLTPV